MCSRAELLERAIRAGYIDAGRFNIPEANVQPASLDLRLGERALRIRCSFLPGEDPVERKLKDYILDEVDLRGDGAMLEARCPYLIELKERLDLPAGLRGKANPKSSTGRIDVFTRVITDHSDRFDEVAPGYQGPLYLEVVPLSFAVRVKEDLTLNQLRLTMGRPGLSDDQVRQAHREAPILYRGGAPVPTEELSLSHGLFLGLDLRGDARGQVGYSTRDSAPLLDLAAGAEVDPRPFWDPVFREEGDRLVLSPRRFYLLMSDEAVSIPPNLAAEMTAYDPTSGELRSHYAGFFDPGFGFDPTGGFKGSRAALEVRGTRRPVHGRERASGVQADLRADARRANRALRIGYRLLVPTTRGDPQPVLSPHVRLSGATQRAVNTSGDVRAIRARVASMTQCRCGGSRRNAVATSRD